MVSRVVLLMFLFTSLAVAQENRTANRTAKPELPAPYATKSTIKHPQVIGWPEGKTPKAPDGFRVHSKTLVGFMCSPTAMC
jgi:hypothetical protein